MNGYTQIKLDKLRGFKWGKYASEMYMRMAGNTDLMASESTAIIIYCGLRGNCFVKQTDPDFTFEDVVDWSEMLPEDDFKVIHEAIESSKFFQGATKKKEESPLPLSGGGKQKKQK